MTIFKMYRQEPIHLAWWVLLKRRAILRLDTNPVKNCKINVYFSSDKELIIIIRPFYNLHSTFYNLLYLV